MKGSTKKELLSWGLTILIALALALFINKVVLFKAEAISASMENTIMTDEKAWCFRLAYLLKEPKRGDIIIFKYPDDEELDYIKRIIGTPGDTIKGIDGLVYINDIPLKEEYVLGDEESLKTMEDFGPYIVPEDSYFVMGDNRLISEDSRDWENKFVHKDKIYGRVFVKYPNIKFFH